ncbi:MAG: peptidylprolyl isomerase [Nanoarchaeota archaeon]
MTLIKKNDFIEIDFTGYANNQIFDTTNSKDAEKIGLEIKDIKPLTISVGNQMVIKGLDEDLEKKEIGKEYSVDISPEKAFGKRNPSMIKTYGINNFKKQNLNPYTGMVLQLDNMIAKVISVNGGRVTVDFNNPLAGKSINYKYKINKIITEDKEKVNAIQDFFFRKRLEFIIKDKKVIFKDEEIKPFIELINPKLKDMTGLTFEIEIKSENKEIKEKTII